MLPTPVIAGDGTVSGYQQRLSDGSLFEWTGFYTGPEQMPADRIAEAARSLLHVNVDGIAAEAAGAILPSSAPAGGAPSIYLHSATPVLMTLEGDIDLVTRGGRPEDVATFIETRAVSLARPGDLVVGRTRPWRVAAQAAGVEAVEIPDVFSYYLSQAIIREALKGESGSLPIARLVKALRERPDSVIRVYCLDLETQLVLLYLRKAAGIAHIHADANSPQVSEVWNAKAPLHPAVGDAKSVRAAGGDPRGWLAAETERAPFQSVLGAHYERVPGYTIDTAVMEPDEVHAALTDAAAMLRHRFHLTHGCLKPSAGAGGNRISGGVDLRETQALRALAEPMCGTREKYVLEAQVSYLPLRLGRHGIRLNPSAHVRYGQTAPGVTLQLSHGNSWQGNVYTDAPAWEALGLQREHYESMLHTVEQFRATLSHRNEHLVTGGVDFAIGTVGGAFGGQVFVAAQDPNLSSHGGELLRRYLDDADGQKLYAATKVVCPTVRGQLPVLRSMATGRGLRAGAAICAVPGRWGMVAADGATPAEALAEVLSFEADLVRQGLAVARDR